MEYRRCLALVSLTVCSFYATRLTFAVDLDLSTCHIDEGEESLGQSGLATTGGPNYTDSLAALYIEGYTVKDIR